MRKYYLPLTQITSGTSATVSNGGSIVGGFTLHNYDKSDSPPIRASTGEPTVIYEYVNTKGFADLYPENSVVTARTKTNF